MSTLSDKSQFQASAIKYGDHKLAPVHQEIIDWISKQFGVNALDFFFEKRANLNGVLQQRVHVILDTVEDVKKMPANEVDYALIAERFLKYLESTDSNNSANDPLKSDVFPSDSYGEGNNKSPDIIVTYRPLKGPSREIMKEMYEDERGKILKEFESFWTISQTVVFYYTDAQKNENASNGISTKIKEELAEVDRKFGYEKPLTYYFDSKESFDRDFEGKWHYYWK